MILREQLNHNLLSQLVKKNVVVLKRISPHTSTAIEVVIQKNLQLSSKCYKTNTHCTAAIVLSKQTSSTSLFVTVHKSHYGHHCVLGKLRVPTIQRTAIAGKLAQGVGVQHIMDEIRSSVGDNLERIHLITRKDIANIERSYGLQGNKRHDDDATSVHLWVVEMEHAGNKNPVIF